MDKDNKNKVDQINELPDAKLDNVSGGINMSIPSTPTRPNFSCNQFMGRSSLIPNPEKKPLCRYCLYYTPNGYRGKPDLLKIFPSHCTAHAHPYPYVEK